MEFFGKKFQQEMAGNGRWENLIQVGFHGSEFPDFQLFQFPHFQILMGFRGLEFPDFQIFPFPHFQIPMGFHGSEFPDFQIPMSFHPTGSPQNGEKTPKSVGIPGVGWEEEKTGDNNPGLNSQEVPWPGFWVGFGAAPVGPRG